MAMVGYRQRKGGWGRILSQMVVLVMVGASVAGALNYQLLWDRYALITYKPRTAVAPMLMELGLTEDGRALAYRADPELDEKSEFNVHCQTQQGELELGCYYNGRIYVLKIANTQLAQEMEVVMAHEMLHSAWTRLSPQERERLGTELEQVYARLGDKELQNRMAGYAKREPGEEANELHSILGTEYTNLTPDLEAYYARYFTDRRVVTAAHARFQAVFDGQRQALETELNQIRTLKAQLASLDMEMNGYKNAGRIAQYNDLVPRQNALVHDINVRIDGYRQGVGEYNALSKSLDSQAITETE